MIFLARPAHYKWWPHSELICFPTIITSQRTSNRRLELLKHIRISEVAIFLKQLYGFWSEKRDLSDKALVEMKQWLGDMTLNVILRMVAGKRYSVGLGDAGGHESESRPMQKAIREFFHFLGLFVHGDAIPYFGRLDLGGYVKAMKKTAKELDDTFDKWLQEHKRKRGGTHQLINEEQDFMDVMLSVLQETLPVLMLILSISPQPWYAKDEIYTRVGRERVVEEADINKLAYVQAIVKESLRLYPAAPLSGPCEFTEDCNIGGRHVPKGTRLITNLWKIQTDPKIWKDLFEFKPERFLTTYKDIDYRSQHFEYIAFGNRRRACPGASFALQMVKFCMPLKS
ncbi:hypothetical protein FEM48_Zijuj06G0073600 [Ziziphus jujuba var. spinosa]|uniref:Cytochrome P450 CYP82D47-like n=1 Tax=Ziziphus jujuba var. spinosa TaxID=714518 RepID=A0A978V7Y1_ZIZJJ|nr:hypothetical protein FEM48_Zijuj06G0073600 [Ziziphus jujuba var. spinosa]